MMKKYIKISLKSHHWAISTPRPQAYRDGCDLDAHCDTVHLADIYMSTAGHPVQSSQIPPALT